MITLIRNKLNSVINYMEKKMEFNLNDLVDEFLRLERFTEESKAFESLAAVPNLSAEDINLERDRQQFKYTSLITQEFRKVSLDAMRDGYLLLAEKLAALVEEVVIKREGKDNQKTLKKNEFSFVFSYQSRYLASHILLDKFKKFNIVHSSI